MMPEICSADALAAILGFIRQLAEYEQLAQTVTATEERVRETLFGINPASEVMVAFRVGECAGFAVFFATNSTFLAQQQRGR